jgi:hypothetical protein
VRHFKKRILIILSKKNHGKYAVGSHSAKIYRNKVGHIREQAS